MWTEGNPYPEFLQSILDVMSQRKKQEEQLQNIKRGE